MTNRWITSTPNRAAAFTLVEMLVSVSVLAVLILGVTELFNSATLLIGLGNKHMTTDGEARELLDRMAIDFGQMVLRTDVDYFVKSGSNLTPATSDQLAFFCEMPGYYSSTTSTNSQSPDSLVAYRVNTDNSTYPSMQRYAMGLLWCGATGTDTPMVFLPQTIVANWPAATNLNADPDYETIGPDTFRFEYFYLLKGQQPYTAILSDTPWNTHLGHTTVNGFRDVAAIEVAVALIDPASRNLVSPTMLSALAGQMQHFNNSMAPGALEAQWQSAILASGSNGGIPRPAMEAIRVYHRDFYLSSPDPLP